MQPAENLSNYMKITAKLRSKGVPAVAALEATYACNLTCRHCYVAGSGSPELETKDYQQLIDGLYDLGTYCLIFTGGEPLLRSDLFDIAAYANEKGFLKVLFTNGTLIDKEMAERIRQVGFWKVEMSIYGACPDTHDRITRCRGSFQKTLSAARLLCENGVDVSLKTLLLKHNIGEYGAMQDVAKEIGVDFRADFQINPKLDGNVEPLRLGISLEEMTSVMKARGDAGLFSCDGMLSVENLTCNAGKHMLSISPSGDVKPCVIFPVSCGNIKKTDVRSIWRSQNGILGQLRALELADLSQCQGCEDRHYCIRCHAASFLHTGDFSSPTPSSCQVAKIRHQLQSEKG